VVGCRLSVVEGTDNRPPTTDVRFVACVFAVTRRSRLLYVFVLITLVAGGAASQDWGQWGGSPQHDGASSAAGSWLRRIHGEVLIDPFADRAKSDSGGFLPIHYPVPLVDGYEVVVIEKGGEYTGRRNWQTQTWSVKSLERVDGKLRTRWKVQSDWKPVPAGSSGVGPTWEPVYQCALTRDAVYAPAAGGTLLKINRFDGSIAARLNPFSDSISSGIFTAGPPAVDAQGNIYYNAIQLDPVNPWSVDLIDAWLVRIGSDGTFARVSFRSLLSGVLPGTALCTTSFEVSQLPFPPSRDAVAPSGICGSQRPGLNVAPAIAPDGTIYTVSRAHFNDRWGYLVALNPDLSFRWATSLRNRFSDGCNVTIPPNGTPGGCRGDARTGVDPADNQLGSGRVLDDSTSSPVVTPDGKILYGAYTRYNYAQGQLMLFAADGTFLTSYGFGWDLTPSVLRHDGTYSIVLKENHYNSGSYCNLAQFCPQRNLSAPADPEQYFITQLDSSLGVEWKFRNINTLSCRRGDDGRLECVEDHPNGFEWCVNALAVDRNGIVFANSQDGYLYAIAPGGVLRDRILLRAALGAAYTPLAIGRDGLLYANNDGILFLVGPGPRSRAVRR
jgi:hypothetical protein